MRISATGATKRLRPETHAGFTAIELILVLTVLVVVAAAVLPGFPAFAQGQRLRSATAQLAGMARYAGDWSVMHERTVVLEYEGEGHRFTLSIAEERLEDVLAVPAAAEEENPDEIPSLDRAWSTLRLPDGVGLEASEIEDGGQFEASGQVRFLPDGRCDAAALVLAAGDLRYTVQIEGRRGRVMVEAGDLLEDGTLQVGRDAR